jgi:2-oxo-3-hexenedioate decarboxylase
MTPAAHDALARELLALDDAPREVPQFTARYEGLSADDGYRAAAQVHAHRLARGWRPVGRKIGFTNRTIWPRYGVHEPMWGTLYDRTLIRAERDHATIPLAALVQPRIEPEICFRLKAVPRSSAPERLLEAIDWIAHSIEIVHCYHPGWKVTLADCTATNGLHGRLIVGTPVPVAQIAGLVQMLPAAEVTLSRGDTVVDRGVGTNVLGSPLAALAHLVDALARRPDERQLEAGEVISTGTLTDAHPVRAGETWTTAFRGLPLPGLTLSFA